MKKDVLKQLRLLQNAMGIDSLSQFTIKMFMIIRNKFTIDNLIQLDNQINLIKLCNNNHQSKPKHTSNNSMSRSKNVDKTMYLTFPLLHLPIDLISKTSLYLNEKDIFNYEQCCRLFYQMVNNTSHLN